MTFKPSLHNFPALLFFIKHKFEYIIFDLHLFILDISVCDVFYFMVPLSLISCVIFSDRRFYYYLQIILYLLFIYNIFIASEKISENLHIFANEPSLACYRLQEHIHKSLPQLVLKRVILFLYTFFIFKKTILIIIEVNCSLSRKDSQGLSLKFFKIFLA